VYPRGYLVGTRRLGGDPGSGALAGSRDHGSGVGTARTDFDRLMLTLMPHEPLNPFRKIRDSGHLGVLSDSKATQIDRH
jgi:hypothetical protein